MPFMQKQSIVLLHDIQQVRLQCECGTSLVLNMENPPKFRAEHGIQNMKCPGCHKELLATPLVQIFMEAYKNLLSHADKVSFLGHPTQI